MLLGAGWRPPVSCLYVPSSAVSPFTAPHQEAHPGCLCLRDTICQREVDSPRVGISLFCLCFLSWDSWLGPERILFRKVVQESRTVRRNQTFQGPAVAFPGRREKGLGWSLPAVSSGYTSPEPALPKEAARKTFYQNSRAVQAVLLLTLSVVPTCAPPFRTRRGRALTCLNLTVSFRVVITRGVMSSLK